MKTFIIVLLLAIFFIYLVIWTLQLHFLKKRKEKVKRVQELRERRMRRGKTTEDYSVKDYWYNLRELEECKEEENYQNYYHYFDNVDQCVHDLLLEMYDNGIVRSDELEEIAYGKNHFQDVDLSFLKEIEEDISEEQNDKLEHEEYFTLDNQSIEEKQNYDMEQDIVQFESISGEDISDKNNNIFDAAKSLKKDDPGIMDIHGTLSQGVETVIAAVDAEKREEEQKEEPILPKKEKSIEQAQKARKLTSNAGARNKIYEKWIGYVSELYELVKINAKEDTQNKIRKALIEYGYNDVDVLLESPE